MFEVAQASMPMVVESLTVAPLGLNLRLCKRATFLILDSTLLMTRYSMFVEELLPQSHHWISTTSRQGTSNIASFVESAFAFAQEFGRCSPV